MYKSGRLGGVFGGDGDTISFLALDVMYGIRTTWEFWNQLFLEIEARNREAELERNGSLGAS